MHPRARSFIGVLASLVLTLSGFARVALAADPGRPCHPAMMASTATHLVHDEHAAHHEHGSHDHGSDHHGHGHHAAHQDYGAAPDHSGTDQSCFKCCGMCTAVGTYVVTRSIGEVLLIAEAVLYPSRTQGFAGRAVIIDPGIPKPIG